MLDKPRPDQNKEHPLGPDNTWLD